MVLYATRELETDLLRSYPLVAGMDEVGRGALAGPVTVGVAIVGRDQTEQPEGLGDSKVLSPARREALVDPIRKWVSAWGVGHSSPAEIDEWGIIRALRVAGQRALAQALSAQGVSLLPGVIILDGIHDWLSEPEADLFSVYGEGALAASEWVGLGVDLPPVRMQVKADLQCAVVAAASVLAKVERDALMEGYDDPGYGWASNKGYGSLAHTRAIERLGVSDLHRRSWKLPGVKN